MKYSLLMILALLHLVAGIAGLKEKHLGPYPMILGSIILLITAILGITQKETHSLLISSGIGLIILSAIYNGYQQGKIHWNHHLVRTLLFIVSILPIYFF